MSSKKTSASGLERLAGFWGGSLGFVVGAALLAWLGKLAGWWPPSETYLKRTNRK